MLISSVRICPSGIPHGPFLAVNLRVVTTPCATRAARTGRGGGITRSRPADLSSSAAGADPALRNAQLSTRRFGSRDAPRAASRFRSRSDRRTRPRRRLALGRRAHQFPCHVPGEPARRRPDRRGLQRFGGRTRKRSSTAGVHCGAAPQVARLERSVAHCPSRGATLCQPGRAIRRRCPQPVQRAHPATRELPAGCSVREVATRERIEAFFTALARETSRDTDVFLVGGTTAVMIGWRPSTMDIDFVMRPESDALLRAIPRLNECGLSGLRGSAAPREPAGRRVRARRGVHQPAPQVNADQFQDSPRN